MLIHIMNILLGNWFNWKLWFNELILLIVVWIKLIVKLKTLRQLLFTRVIFILVILYWPITRVLILINSLLLHVCLFILAYILNIYLLRISLLVNKPRLWVIVRLELARWILIIVLIIWKVSILIIVWLLIRHILTWLHLLAIHLAIASWCHTITAILWFIYHIFQIIGRCILVWHIGIELILLLKSTASTTHCILVLLTI